MKLTYWTIKCINDAHCYNIRSKTKKGAIETLLNGDFDPAEYDNEVWRMTLEYKDAFDLLDGAFSEEREDANLIDSRAYSIAHLK